MSNSFWVITFDDEKFMISNDDRCIWNDKNEALAAYKQYYQFWKKNFVNNSLCNNSLCKNKKPILKEYKETGNVYYE